MKNTYFPYEIIQLSTWMRWPSPSVCQSLDFEKETFWCDSCFPYKVYFLYIKDIWFASPKYVQINLSLYLSIYYFINNYTYYSLYKYCDEKTSKVSRPMWANPRQFWIPHCGFRIPGTGFRIANQWKLDFGFLELEPVVHVIMMSLFIVFRY